MKKGMIEAFAGAYEEMMDPFSGDFLAEHNVSADDCFAMSSLIATLLRSYVAMPSQQRAAMLLRGIGPSAGLSAEDIENGIAHASLGPATDNLVAELRRIRTGQ